MYYSNISNKTQTQAQIKNLQKLSLDGSLIEANNWQILCWLPSVSTEQSTMVNLLWRSRFSWSRTWYHGCNQSISQWAHYSNLIICVLVPVELVIIGMFYSSQYKKNIFLYFLNNLKGKRSLHWRCRINRWGSRYHSTWNWRMSLSSGIPEVVPVQEWVLYYY